MAKKNLPDTTEPATAAPAKEPILREIKTIEYETFESFARRNGEYIILGELRENLRDGSFVGESLVFANGATARSKDERTHCGVDPEDMPPLEVLRNRFTFVSTKIEREKSARARFIADIAQQARWHRDNPNACPPPPDDWKEQARLGQERIRALAAEGEKILEELQRTDPDLQRRQRREEQMQQHFQKADALVAEIEMTQ